MFEKTISAILEKEGFVRKPNIASFDWSYIHPQYMVVVCRKVGGSSFFFFNYLSKFMRDTVKSQRGTILDINKFEKEQLYRNALRKLDFYSEIKDDLKFSFRKKGGDFVGISENAGLKTLKIVLEWIIVTESSRNTNS